MVLPNGHMSDHHFDEIGYAACVVAGRQSLNLQVSAMCEEQV